MRELNSQGPIRKTNTTYLCSDRAMARAAQLVAMATPRCRARAPCPASPAKKSTRGPHLLPIPSPLLPLLSPFSLRTGRHGRRPCRARRRRLKPPRTNRTTPRDPPRRADPPRRRNRAAAPPFRRAARVFPAAVRGSAAEIRRRRVSSAIPDLPTVLLVSTQCRGTSLPFSPCFHLAGAARHRRRFSSPFLFSRDRP